MVVGFVVVVVALGFVSACFGMRYSYSEARSFLGLYIERKLSHTPDIPISIS